MEFGAPFYQEFADIWKEQDGYRLARTLSPELSTEKLRKIHRSQNVHSIKNAVKRGLQGSATPFGIDQAEVQGWAEVYSAYWTATEVILDAWETSNGDSTVSSPCRSGFEPSPTVQTYSDMVYSHGSWYGRGYM